MKNDKEKAVSTSCPTSSMNVYCDTYDQEMTVSYHQVNGKTKACIYLNDKEILSLWKEDVEHLATFMLGMTNVISEK